MKEGEHYIITDKIYQTDNFIEDIDEVKRINTLKTSYDITYQSEYGDLSGIPVKEIGGKLVPWFDSYKKYDTDMYFEMAGGWDIRESMSVNDINGNEIDLSSYGPYFKETQKYIKYVNDIDELLNLDNNFIQNNDFVYVYNITTTEFNTENASHYFYINNIRNSMYIDNEWDESKETSELKGWYPIPLSEITTGTSSVIGEKLLQYLTYKEETSGNNPHYGNKQYDKGESWINNFRHIFNGSIENLGSFIGVDDVVEEEAFNFGFDLILKDATNGKTFIVTDEIEAAKILNSKQLEISFIPGVYTKEFIEEYVLFYLKQIIPSTTIFSITYQTKDTVYGITTNNN
jgi:hypothetical protein